MSGRVLANGDCGETVRRGVDCASEGLAAINHVGARTSNGALDDLGDDGGDRAAEEEACVGARDQQRAPNLRRASNPRPESSPSHPLCTSQKLLLQSSPTKRMMAAGTPAQSPMSKPNEMRSFVAKVCWIEVSVRLNSRLKPAFSVRNPITPRRTRVKIQSVEGRSVGRRQLPSRSNTALFEPTNRPTSPCTPYAAPSTLCSL